MSRLVVFVETSQTLSAILFFTAIAYKQNRIVAINETQTLILCLEVERARSKMLCVADYIFDLLCAFNCLQPMKKFVFSVASRATVVPKSYRPKGQPRSTRNEFPIRADFGNSRKHPIWRPKRGENWQPEEPFYRQRSVIYGIVDEACDYCDLPTVLSPVLSSPFINVYQFVLSRWPVLPKKIVPSNGTS